MNRIILLIAIGLLVLMALYFASNPQVLHDIWIWLVGLSGAIVKAFQLIIEYFKDKFSDDVQTTEDLR